MKLGVLTVPLGGLSLDEACRYLSERGVQMVEIGCGGFPGKAHCDAAELLRDDAKCKAFMDTLAKYGLQISALSSTSASQWALPGQPPQPISTICTPFAAR